MKQDLTTIAFILDRSGSMESMAEAAIAGFNQFLRDQQAATGEARLTLILFDDQYEVPAKDLPVAEVVELDHRTFVPRGSTALLDAIGRTIDELGKELAATPEDHRPSKVIVAILTDGFENASRQYRWHDIQDRIRHQRDHYSWDFLFLGANQDAIATAGQMGIQSSHAATFCADAIGKGSADRALSRKIQAMRAEKSRPLTAEEKGDLEAPMQSIVEEEDRKERGK